jgi:trans-2,3-dihydro-3-hydroxyanthranilate isomerase
VDTPGFIIGETRTRKGFLTQAAKSAQKPTADRSRRHPIGVDRASAAMKTYAYRLLDVFTDVPFGGNPLAVFTEASGLSDSLMQNIARELNLSETTFVLPPRDRTNHYWVRIFTPLTELHSGGVPTIGTAFALALEERLRQDSLRQRVVFEEATGPVSVTMEAPMLSMQQPLPELGPIFQERDAVAAMLGLDTLSLAPGMAIQSVSCGVPFLLVPVADLEAMQRIRFRMDIWERVLRRTPHPHVYAFTLECKYSGSSAHCRMFAPGLGVQEDPATAAAAGPLGGYFAHWNLLPESPRISFICEQGIEIGRPSFIHVTMYRQGGQVSSLRIGGQCVAIGTGQIQV